MCEPVTWTQLLEMMAIGPPPDRVSEPDGERAGFASGSPTPGSALPSDPFDYTPFGRAVLEAQELRLMPDLDAHRERLRTLTDVRLALYLADSVFRSGLASFGPVSRNVVWEPGMPAEGSHLFYLGVDLQIPNQRYRQDLGGRIYLHVSDQLSVVDAVLRIRYIDHERGYELRPLGRGLAGALFKIAVHHARAIGRPDYLHELQEQVAHAAGSDADAAT
jgi:hypothetical protein